MIRRQNSLFSRNSRICAVISPKMDQQKVFWCLVPLIWVTARLVLKWSEAKITKIRNRYGTPPDQSSFETIHSIATCLLGKLPTSLAVAIWKGNGEQPARSTWRRVTIARLRLVWLLFSASVEISPPPEQTTAASARPVKIPAIYHHHEFCQMQS